MKSEDLVDKWDTFLDGVDDNIIKQNMAQMLQKQAEHLGETPYEKVEHPTGPQSEWSNDDLAKAAEIALAGGKCSNCNIADDCPFKDKVCAKWMKIPNLLGLDSILPIIRNVYPSTIANNLVSVQPMAPPDNTIFHLDYTYGDDDK